MTEKTKTKTHELPPAEKTRRTRIWWDWLYRNAPLLAPIHVFRTASGQFYSITTIAQDGPDHLVVCYQRINQDERWQNWGEIPQEYRDAQL